MKKSRTICRPHQYVPYATAVVAFGAGFLSARAVTVYLRTRS